MFYDLARQFALMQTLKMENADRLGYHAYACIEHFFFPKFGVSPDPLALFSFVAWAIYAATLAGRAAAGWHGRRAAYFAVMGFAALVVTLGAGLFLPGRHGS